MFNVKVSTRQLTCQLTEVSVGTVRKLEIEGEGEGEYRPEEEGERRGEWSSRKQKQAEREDDILLTHKDPIDIYSCL